MTSADRQGFGRRAVLAALAALALMALVPAMADARPPKTFYGLTPQAQLGAYELERMGLGRVGTLRVSVAWGAVDETPVPGDTNWGLYDQLIGSAAQVGIQVLPVFDNVPGWVAALDNCKEGCTRFAPRSELSLMAWRDFIRSMVERYGPEGTYWAEHPELQPKPIRAWQIWNEQNSPTFYSPKPDVAAYAKLLKAGHAAITSEDRGAEIILGGMFGTPQGGRKPGIAAWDFLSRLYQRGAKRHFDAVAPHPYAPKFDDVLLQVELLRDEMRKANDRSADLRITELGWASGGPKHPLNRGRRGQADRLAEAFRYFINKRKKLNVRSLNWYSWRDNSGADSGVCSWCPFSGLLDEDLNAKPALRAFTNFTGGS